MNYEEYKKLEVTGWEIEDLQEELLKEYKGESHRISELCGRYPLATFNKKKNSFFMIRYTKAINAEDGRIILLDEEPENELLSISYCLCEYSCQSFSHTLWVSTK